MIYCDYIWHLVIHIDSCISNGFILDSERSITDIPNALLPQKFSILGAIQNVIQLRLYEIQGEKCFVNIFFATKGNLLKNNQLCREQFISRSPWTVNYCLVLLFF